MTDSMPGIHHVTAICGDPQRNADFYVGVLGLRLVKRTVNFDDPTAYHLYYGDELGRPGTIMTFFAWPGAPRGRRGTGQITAVGFRIPRGTTGWWRKRLSDRGIEAGEPRERFDERVLAFEDPDGLRLELVERPELEGDPHHWTAGPVPAARAIRGFHGITITAAEPEETVALLAGALRFRVSREANGRRRLATGEADAVAPGREVDVCSRPGDAPGRIAVGSVHHVAFRARDDTDQLEWRDRVARAGLHVTPVRDRQYFRSIYFREPGGVLFEIATDPPGFTKDESEAALGSELKLPPWLEERRPELERGLPPIRPPEFQPAAP